MKMARGTSLHDTLHFLLDHPRRCTIYLFPSHQTWLLFGVTVLLQYVSIHPLLSPNSPGLDPFCLSPPSLQNSNIRRSHIGFISEYRGFDWFCFMVLNIGIPVYEAIPLGTRFADGLLQSTSARAAGFAVLSLSGLAPALL